MKIGFIIYGSLDTVSGGYLYDRKLVEYLREHGDTAEIISLSWRNYAAHLTDNLHFRLPLDFDLIIQDELNHPSLLFANRSPHPCPVISLVHHLRCSEMRPKWQNVFYRRIEKRYLQSVDGFVFNSKTTKKVMTELINNNKPSIVAHPPTDRFGEGRTKSEITERAMRDEFRIVFLGNVIFRKGLHTLLKAIKSLNLNIHVDVIGSTTSEPHYAKEMKTYVHTHNLDSRVTFHSSLDNEPLTDKLSNAHLLIVPSSYEGFGIVYLEGMCFGLPAIGTTAGAASEIITHGQDGYLIEPDDEKALANHITELATDQELLLQLSFNAVKRYKAQPKWDETAIKIRDFLYQFAGAWPSRPVLGGETPPLRRA
ncbi:MAG TPA: glycosyltransferase family 4 protein [Anaerolineales bacterium]|nr:glycosyltransferase family 4 protein [Anaerolineales bacterium]